MHIEYSLTSQKVGHIFDLWNIVIPDVTFFAKIRKDLIEFFACLGWVVFLQVGNNGFPSFNFFRCVFHGWDGFVTINTASMLHYNKWVLKQGILKELNDT